MCREKLRLQIPDSDRTIVIDLLSIQDEGIVLIPTGTKFVLPNKRGLFGQRRFNKGSYIAKIRPLDCDIEFSRNPLLCSFLQSGFANDCSFEVNGECEIPYSIALDKKAFLNFKNVVLSEEKLFELPFTLEIYNKEGEKMHDEVLEEKLFIRAKAFRSEVKFSYTPEKRKITYHAPTPNPEDSLHKVGVLHVEHNGNVSCVPPMQSFSITLETSRMGCDGHLACFCTKPTNDSNYRSTNRNIQIFQLVSGQCIDIPIYWNMVEINNNPLEATQYDFLINYNSNSRKEGEILLNRDTSVTEPDVRIQMGKDSIDQVHLFRSAKEKKECSLPRPIYIAYDQEHVISYDGELVFENLAQSNNNNESIGIWDIQTDVYFAEPTDAGRLKLLQNKTLQDVVRIDKCSTFLHLGPCEKYIIPICIEEKWIQSIEAAASSNITEVDIVIKISYRLYVDLTGNYYLDFEQGNVPANLCPIPYENELQMKIQKQPNPEWMCVDFGTSAIVAGISNEQRGIDYIDLKNIKDRLLVSANPSDQNKQKNSDENAPFISSSICLNPDYFRGQNQRDFRYVTTHETEEGKSASDFMLYPIWFSPGEGIIYRDYQIPCLKTIVGYKEIPNIFRQNDANVKNWRYVAGKETVRLIQENDDNTFTLSELLQINNIFQIVYKQLFTHYLKIKYLSNRRIIHRQINQLVLTVPNTYTPYNIDTIRKIARSTIPSIYPEYLTMVSESDAVSCYYLLHRKEFLLSKELTSERLKRMQEHEEVLVYDMGAGTLDLTFFSIDNTSSGETQIDIKSKLGINIAGNYLDYTIAEILIDLYKKSGDAAENTTKKLQSLLLLNKEDAISRGVSSRERNDLKQYVKNIKTHLNESEYIIPTLQIGNATVTFNIKSSDILNHHFFKRFTDAITTRVLTNFINDFNGKIHIDTVIFSGRSTELLCIREQVKNTLSTICSNAADILYADICGNKFHKSIEFDSTHTSGLLKKVVTEGALAYADRYNRPDVTYQFVTRANYATFGIVALDINDNYYWYPLLEKGQKWGKTGVVLSDIKIINTQGLLWIDFIQTYSNNVIEDYTNKRFDMISRLFRCSDPIRSYKDGLKVRLSYNNQAIRHDAKSALTLYLNDREAPIQPHEDFNDMELRKSLWPVIF